jgi:hypothetical protein
MTVPGRVPRQELELDCSCMSDGEVSTVNGSIGCCVCACVVGACPLWVQGHGDVVKEWRRIRQ